jgi:F-type H+-transporting ATPase subunit alpha
VIKNLGGGVKLSLAQYRELAAFAQFASDLDEITRKQLERGRMVTELMKQPQFATMKIAEMALTLFGVNKGYYDDVPVAKALAFESAFKSFMKNSKAALMNKIETTKALDAESEKELAAAFVDFKKTGTY